MDNALKNMGSVSNNSCVASSNMSNASKKRDKPVKIGQRLPKEEQCLNIWRGRRICCPASPVNIEVRFSKPLKHGVGHEVGPVHGNGLVEFVGTGEILFKQIVLQLRGKGRVGGGDVFLLAEVQA